MSKNAYVKEQHKRDCLAMAAVRKGDWKHPLFSSGKFVTATKNGVVRKNNAGWTQFAVIGCNDPHCPYEVWVNQEAIEEYIYGRLL